MGMKVCRGDLIVCVISGDYGKPRPAIVMQSDLYNNTHASMTVCPITSDLNDWPLFRVTLEPSSTNGLKHKSQVMIDKIITVPRDKIKQIIGKVSAKDLKLIGETLKNWLSL
jgi:mRNA interferase MazF